jgi:uncharacterized protein YdhG (YjbR/CyaY superfamily)
MTVIDDYFATITPDQKAAFQQIREIVMQTVSPTEDGLSYAMPTILYKGKGLVSCMANKNFLSLYPFSGKVVDKLKEDLKGFETTTGSIHFSIKKPLSEELIKKIVSLRVAEIEERAAKK